MALTMGYAEKIEEIRQSVSAKSYIDDETWDMVEKAFRGVVVGVNATVAADYYGNVGKVENSYGKSIEISQEKMYQQGQHYNKHGRDMGYSSKKEYEQAARDFFEQNKNTSEIYEGIWNNSRGGQSGQRQIIMRKDGRQLIINKQSGQIIDFYEGTSLDGFIDIERVQ